MQLQWNCKLWLIFLSKNGHLTAGESKLDKYVKKLVKKVEFLLLN